MLNYTRILDEFKKSNLIIKDEQKLQNYIYFCLEKESKQNNQRKNITTSHTTSSKKLLP